MILTEVTRVASEALPLARLKEHLRLASGFEALPEQDTLLEGYMRAALALIEGRTGKALLERPHRLSLSGHNGEVALPIAPVNRIAAVTLIAADGTPTALAEANYRLRPDLHRPRLTGRLPEPAEGARLEILFDAGFGPQWGDVPEELQQAALLMAAEFYEHRHDDGAAAAGLPGPVASLIERWRKVRVLIRGRR